MKDYCFELPFPPTNNHYFTVARGRKILSSKGRKYKAECLKMMALQKVCDLNLGCRLSVEINFIPPDNRKRDLDNFLKSPLDAITQSGFWSDDSQIDEIKITRFEKEKNGRLEIFVRELQPSRRSVYIGLC